MLYGTESAEEIKIAGNGDFYGVVHAPTADVTIAGNGDLYGAAIGKTLTTNGNGAIHYDECLGKGDNSSGDPFRVAFWRLN
jgi:choice-of-anchor A domain-containing protein